ncbi:hypothetical protein ASG43_21625 [Aureimonas sp. Leaf454]|nr:hypothetical protein ASG43_21625 [Aureimonas sp. Leaf454]
MFHAEAIEQFAVSAAQFLRDGSDYRDVVATIVRSGDRLPPDRVRALGLPPSYLIGRDFSDGLITRDVVSAPGRLEDMIHLACSRAAQLHALRIFQKDNIRYVRLLSPRDVRQTALERRFSSRKITMAEATELVTSRGDEMRRSTFAAVVDHENRNG